MRNSVEKKENRPQVVDHHCSCRKLQASVLLLAQSKQQKVVSLMHVYICILMALYRPWKEFQV